MKLNIFFFLFFSLVYGSAISQQSYCADSSYRIKYIFGNEGASLLNIPDTSGLNLLHGNFYDGTNTGIALLKTNWGDSIIWSRKIYINGASFDGIQALDGSIFLTGFYGTAPNLQALIIKINSNGVVQWAKRYFPIQPQNIFGGLKDILVTNNAIYIFNIGIAKLDLNGNILWSKNYLLNSPRQGSFGSSFWLFNNELFIWGQAKNSVTPGPGSEPFVTLNKLNDADGSLNESFAYKTAPENFIKGINLRHSKLKNDNLFTLSGYINIDITGTGLYAPRFLCFTNFDNNFNPIQSNYFRSAIPLDIFAGVQDLNNLGQKAVLARDASNFNTTSYFLSFNKVNDIERSRKFVVPLFNPATNGYSINLDDKQNIHFLYNYNQSNKIVTEYARISNFAPNGTLGCFGKDTSILTRYPFTLTKEPFVWDNVQSNILVSNDVPYTEDTAIVTKEVVCKIVSRCDSVHINGRAAACVGVPVRYTVSKNNGCFKNLDWGIDTTVANIINLEGDSAITLSFKKTFTGYIHAALTDCVVKDSFLVTALLPKMLPLTIRKDSLLCPGKTLLLAASNGYTNYQWQGNTAGQQFTVSNPGVYSVSALDSCGIARADSIRVTLADTSLIIPAAQTICLYDTAFITLPNDVNNITWQPTANAALKNKTLLFYPQQTTLYTITAERTPNCAILKNTTVVIQPCVKTVFVPNAFSPNKDGRNDLFKPTISQPLAFYRLQIFNRYGQTIFETSNQQNGWDGTFKGSTQPMGGYIYQCSYRFAGGTQQMVKGYFILVR